MRISKAKAQENRERVIGAATRLMREKGIGGAGVAELMAAAGLTHGGFYNHFESKDDAEAAACAEIFSRSIQKMRAIADAGDDGAFDAYCQRYVSTESRDAPGAACPMVAFAADVSRSAAPIRKVYAEGLADYLDAFVTASGGSREQALRDFATLVGLLTLARSVAAENPDMSDEILACGRGSKASADQTQLIKSG